MSTIPLSAFATKLQALDHETFCEFVADLWSLAGWETTVERPVVVAQKNGRTQRLLVLAGGRWNQVRSETPAAETFDQVVLASVEDGETTPRGVPDAPLVDARELRHRLIYGTKTADAGALWSRYFDDDLRGEQWDTPQREWTLTHRLAGTLALVLLLAGIGVLVFGLPFLAAEQPPPETDASVFAGGWETDIDIGSPEQTTERPETLAWEETVYAGTENGTIGAVDAEAGETIWTSHLGEEIESHLVANGTLYAHAGGEVYALDAVTGESQGMVSDSTRDVTTGVTVVDETLYVGMEDALVALDAETGEPRWEESLSGTITAPPTVYEETVYATSSEGVYALERETGETEWTNIGESSGQNETERRAPVVMPGVTTAGSDNATLVVTMENRVQGLDSGTGALDWEFESQVTGALSAPVVLDPTTSLKPPTINGSVEQNQSNQQNESSEQNQTGEQNETSEQNETNVSDSTDLSDPTVYVADIRAFVYALDPESGERRWTYEDAATRLDHPVAGGPSANETAHSVYVLGANPAEAVDQKLFAVNASSGNERWQYQSLTQTLSAPTVADETLYTGTERGDLLALETEAGTETWNVETFEETVTSAPTVVSSPAFGDSVDSRVRLGIEGHHDWLYQHEQSSTTTQGVSVVDVDVTETVATGERVELRASIVNRGDTPHEVPVDVDTDWEFDGVLSTTSVDLEPGEAKDVVFSFAGPAEPGEGEISLLVDGQEFDVTTTVVESPAILIDSLDDPENVWRGDEIEIITTVNNTGDVEATAPVGLEFGGEVVDSTQEALEANETAAVTLSLSLEDVPAGEYNYSVATRHDVQRSSLEVLAVDDRADTLPLVTQFFGVTLIFGGVAVGWWVVTDVRGSLRGRNDSSER